MICYDNHRLEKQSCNFIIIIIISSIIIIIIYYAHSMANSLPESQNRSGVSSWPA